MSKLRPETLRQARRLVILVIGLTLLLFGAVMLVAPGPGLLVIFAGLSLLAVEFVWARRLLQKLRAAARQARNRISAPPEKS